MKTASTSSEKGLSPVPAQLPTRKELEILRTMSDCKTTKIDSS